VNVNSCFACDGDKGRNWLLKFIDAQAMGLPDGFKLGRLCKLKHFWNGHEITLRDRQGKCPECEKIRKQSPEYIAARNKRYESNGDEIRRKARERMAARRQDPEQRRIQSERNRLCKARRRATHGRESRSRNGLPYMYLEQHGFARRHAGQIAEMHAAGLEPEAIRLSIALREALRKPAGHSPSVADLVEAERRRYLREHPEIQREAGRIKSQQRHRLRYLTDPAYRLYHRQKSKRRKAQMRNSVAIQLSGKQIRARFAQFNHRCAYCGNGGELHIEHVVPISKGGTHAIGNVVPACERCNYSKTTHEVESWYRSQPFFSDQRWRKICRVLGWQRSSVGQLALL